MILFHSLSIWESNVRTVSAMGKIKWNLKTRRIITKTGWIAFYSTLFFILDKYDNGQIQFVYQLAKCSIQKSRSINVWIIYLFLFFPYESDAVRFYCPESLSIRFIIFRVSLIFPLLQPKTILAKKFPFAFFFNLFELANKHIRSHILATSLLLELMCVVFISRYNELRMQHSFSTVNIHKIHIFIYYIYTR